MSSFAVRLLRGAEWRDLMDLLSPALIETLPPSSLASAASSLARARLDRRGQEEALRDRAELMGRFALPVVTAAAPAERGGPGAPASPRDRGDALLRLYFHQLVHGETAFLDLRPERFDAADLPLVWRPGWARYTWQDDFQHAVHDMYAGYYEGDAERFDAALEPLGIAPARQIFLDHFGTGDQRGVRFRAQDFRETFRAAFVACRDAGTRLHPDFVPLGVMLATLYAHLEPLDVALDVRAAWMEAAGSAEDG